jgi:hypothetical protein
MIMRLVFPESSKNNFVGFGKDEQIRQMAKDGKRTAT